MNGLRAATTCIGNSGPLQEPIEKAIQQADLSVASVLSGNRNLRGRGEYLCLVDGRRLWRWGKGTFVFGGVPVHAQGDASVRAVAESRTTSSHSA